MNEKRNVRQGAFVTLPQQRIARVQRIERGVAVLVSGDDVAYLHASGKLEFAGRVYENWQPQELS